MCNHVKPINKNTVMKQKVHVSNLGRGSSRGRFTMLFLLGALLSPFVGEEVFAQTSAPTYPHELTMWTGLEESPAMVDVSFHVVQCQAGAASQVMLQVFNEGDLASSIGFTLTITDVSSGQSFSHTVASFPLSTGDMVTGECGSSTHANLIIDLPAGYDGSNVSLEITYN